MTCEPFVTVPEFIDSSFYCGFASCCAISGTALSGHIEGLISISQDLISSYLGWDICEQVRKDIFTGDDSNSYFLNYLPISTTGVIEVAYRTIPRLYSNYAGHTTTTGIITGFNLTDDRTGWMRFNNMLSRDIEYTINYTAGYNIIPNQIKQAMFMMIVNLNQRLDNMQLSNPDFTLDTVRVDKSISTSFGAGKMIKQAVLKRMEDFNDLPIPVMMLLRRYKYNSGT